MYVLLCHGSIMSHQLTLMLDEIMASQQTSRGCNAIVLSGHDFRFYETIYSSIDFGACARVHYGETTHRALNHTKL